MTIHDIRCRQAAAIPVIVIAVGAELVRRAFRYSWKGDLIATVIMTFSTFGYYGQIWFNRDFTYESAVAEMPAGYADTLMAVSPAWALPNDYRLLFLKTVCPLPHHRRLESFRRS